jgi:hypothetical protein
MIYLSQVFNRIIVSGLNFQPDTYVYINGKRVGEKNRVKGRKINQEKQRREREKFDCENLLPAYGGGRSHSCMVCTKVSEYKSNVLFFTGIYLHHHL